MLAWYLDLPAALDQTDVALLDGGEKARLARFARAEDRARYAACHAGARRLLAARLSVAPSQVTLARRPCPACGSSEHGPPVARVDGEELAVSLSRSGRHGLVALSRNGPVGADVEVLDDAFPVDGVAALFFAPEEAELLARLPRPERAVTFFRAWARKEAAAKAWGTGLAEDLREVEVQAARPGPVSVRRPGGGASSWVVHDLGLPAGALGALCAGPLPPALLDKPRRPA